MNLGSIKVDFPVYLAPMVGITDISFRLLMREMGCGITVTELISSEAMIRYSARTRRMIRVHEGERPVGVQVFGADPVAMADTAKMVEQESGCDFIDINLGCPVRKIVKQGAGAALLQDCSSLAKVLDKVKAAISIPLTIKIRTGFTNTQPTYKEVIQTAYDCGVGAVAIHGRSREQAYEGQADWQAIAEAKRDSPIPIIGNGDLITWQKALHRWQESDCDGIMIGRAALKNPWIFQELRKVLNGEDPNTVERKPHELLVRHARLLLEFEREDFACLKLKKFIAWYTAGIPGGSKLRGSLFSVKNFDDVYKRGIDFFANYHNWQPQIDPAERFLMGGHG